VVSFVRREHIPINSEKSHFSQDKERESPNTHQNRCGTHLMKPKFIFDFRLIFSQGRVSIFHAQERISARTTETKATGPPAKNENKEKDFTAKADEQSETVKRKKLIAGANLSLFFQKSRFALPCMTLLDIKEEMHFRSKGLVFYQSKQNAS
jgi:hypothetical protein